MRRPGRPLTVVAVLAIGLALRLGFIWNGPLDPDESQHLHDAWLVAHGQVVYVDFWEHHSPLFYYVVAPLTRLFTDSAYVYLTARGLMLAITGVAFVLLYLALRRLGSSLALLAIGLLCLQPRLIQYTIQIRPDVPAICAWLAVVLALIRWRETGEPRWIWSAGLLLGLTAAFSPKAVYELIGVGVFIIAAAVYQRTCARQTLTALARVGTGSAVPLLVLSGWMWATGGARVISAFLQSVVIDNLSFPDSSKRGPFAMEGAAFALLAGVGIFVVVRRLRLGVVAHPVHGPLLVPAAVVLVLLLLPTTPAVYEYTWLPVVTVAAVYAAIGVTVVTGIGSWRRGRAALMVAVAVGAFVHPAAIAATAAARNENAALLRDMREELTYACPDDAVFDGTGLYVFRRSASRYGALVVGIRRAMGSGKIPVTGVIDELRLARAPVGLWDRRLQIIGGPIGGFATRYYVHQPDGLLLAGAMIAPAAAGSAGRTSVELLRHTVYRVTMAAGDVVQIDGRTLSSGLRPLTAGRHVVSWSALRGPVSITAATCAERGGAAAADRW